MTITSGAFDSYGIPQGRRAALDDLVDVDTAEATEGDRIALRDGRWVPVPAPEPPSAYISTDANNVIRPGTDALLYSPLSDPYAASLAGGELLVNGYGMLGPYNWPIVAGAVDAITNDVYSGKTAFKVTGTRSVPLSEAFMVDLNAVYRMTGAIKGTPDERQMNYLFIACYDIDGLLIAPYMGQPLLRTPASKTTLAMPLKVGDNTITVVSAAGWNPAQGSRGVLVHPYTNAQGYTYPAYTYSRHAQLSNFTVSGNVITLAAPWAVANPNDEVNGWPVGTPIEQTASGGTYIYPISRQLTGDGSWNIYSGQFGKGTGTNDFWYGTAFVKPGALVNYAPGTASSVAILSAFSVKPDWVDALGGDIIGGTLQVNGDITGGNNLVLDPSLVGGAGGGNLFLKGPAGQTRAVRVMSSGDNKYRWVFGAQSTAESGSNAGSDFYVYAYDDAGNGLGNAFYIFRGTRQARFYAQPDIYPTSLQEGAGSYASGWTRYGTSWTDFAAVRFGPVVSVQGMIGRTSDLAVTAGTAYPMGTLPTGFRPDTKLRVAGFAYYTTGGRTACGIDIASDGGVDFIPIVSGTVQSSGNYVSFSASYRAA